MNLPSAIRKDRDLLALAGLHFLSPYFAFLPFLRWTSYSCPHCNCVFRRDYWPNNVRLGNGERTCQECTRVFDDGSREWPELSLTRRLRFLFPPLLIGISGGFVVAAILSVFITPRDEHSWLVVAIVFGFSLIPVIIWCPVRLVWVLRSKHRYENEPASMRRRLETGGLS
jgi:hypothetical protein